MTWQLDTFTSVFLLATFLTSSVLVYTLRHRQVRGSSYFAALVISVTTWAFFQALEYAVSAPEGKILFAKLQYLGISTIGTTWYLFSLSYNRKENWLGKNYLFLLIIPALTVIAAFTNEAHGLLWPKIEPVSGAAGSNLIYSHGPVFWLIFVYNYITLALGTIIIIRTAINSKEIYRGQMIGLIVSALIPWLGNLIYVSGLSPIKGLDLTPLGFSLSALITAWSIFFLRLFDLVPVARDQLVENLIDGVLVLDIHNRVADINPKARELLGIKNTATVGRNIADFVQPWPELVKEFGEAASEGVTQLHVDDGGEISDIDLHISCLRDERKSQVGRIIVIRDISKQKKLERMRENMTQAIVHDLRNPLTSVALGLEMLRRQTSATFSKGQIDIIDTSRQGVQQMLDLVESILDTYRLENGEMPINLKRTSLYRIASEAIKTTSIQANQKRILVQLDIPQEMQSVMVDPGLMRRVIQNLVDNAVKYSLEGRVVRVQSEFDKKDGTVILSVSDSGNGIESSVRDNLFDKFVSGNDRTNGSGLGLAFCRLVVEAHGGRIWVDEKYQSGTKISLSIPERASGQ